MFGDHNLPTSVLAFGVPVVVSVNVGGLLENREAIVVVRVPVVAVRVPVVAVRARSVPGA